MAATATIKTRAIQGEDLPAREDRLINTILLDEGVIDLAGDSYEVNAQAAPDMSVRVGSLTAHDYAVVEGDNAGQGTFICRHDNTHQDLAIAAADATNPRIDIVVLRVYDNTFDSSGNDYADLEVITGTPAGSPSAPATPSTAIKLATVAVAALAATIVGGNITDDRTEAEIKTSMLSAADHGGLSGLGDDDHTQYLRDMTVDFSQGGDLALVTGSFPWIAQASYTIIGARAGVGTAPTGASLIIDINKNATTIYTTQGNRPTIAAAATDSGAGSTPDVTAVVAGDKITVDIDQIGSTLPGADLVLSLVLRRA